MTITIAPITPRNVPLGWQSIRFTDAFTDRTGGQKKIKKGEYLPAGALPVIDQGQEPIGGYTDDPDAQCNAPLPCLLFGDHTKTVKYCDSPFALGADGVKVLEPRSDIEARFAFHYISALPLPTDAGYSRHFKFLKRTWFPLPPLPEQRRIAAILDKADAIRRKRQQTLDLADQFLHSAFLDMFGDPVTNPKRWPIKKLSEAFVTDIVPTKCGPFGSALRKDEYTDSGVSVLTMNNIAGDSFCLDGCLHITQEKYQDLSTYAVREGDIIISRAGTVGKMCVVPHLDGPAIISTNLIRLSLDGRILEPAFFVALMTYCRGRVGKLRTGNDGSYTFMNTGILRGLPVPFPSPTVQADWVRLLSWMSQHVSRLIGHQGALQDLSDSLIQRAFHGRLQT